MKISYTKCFLKKFKKLPVKIQNKFEDRIGLFSQNTTNPILRDHRLTGNLVDMRAFCITEDYRVIYKYTGKNEIKLMNIGNHSNVY